jgi:hypothetical protein
LGSSSSSIHPRGWTNEYFTSLQCLLSVHQDEGQWHTVSKDCSLFDMGIMHSVIHQFKYKKGISDTCWQMGNHVHVNFICYLCRSFYYSIFVKIPTICTIHSIILKFSHIQSIFQHVLVVATTNIREFALSAKTPLLKLYECGTHR